MEFLAGLLVKLFLGLLQHFQAREDFRRRVLAEVMADANSQSAEAWKYFAKFASNPGKFIDGVQFGGDESITGLGPINPSNPNTTDVSSSSNVEGKDH